MREIEFRFWNKYDGKFEYSTDDSHLSRFFASIDSGELMTDIEYVSRYSGLFDKDTNKIYEFDFVKDFHDGAVKLIEFKLNMGFVLNCGIRDGVIFYESFTGIINPCLEYQVIGNIYENPELLKSS